MGATLDCVWILLQAFKHFFPGKEMLLWTFHLTKQSMAGNCAEINLSLSKANWILFLVWSLLLRQLGEVGWNAIDYDNWFLV